ncbi:DNA-binding GntR family transcriptional regulator [Albidovulum inexpectatum]|uniref:DNA-binding GntR family transcriptional regulator n=1 Tax=Albidovulum inexpectatum TaxID=196587 RepID=A0A2S5JKD7_9RHOB|nr:GntR family transcriptional regulator [Albidovulum inexpectatum]PPB81861.1 DNA-binding GntR family transcriptional regulator [Albidovulum inexpectatum]
MKEITDPTADGKVPTHVVTYRRLRDMILFGQLAPGQSVTIQGLTSLLNAGMTPVREAIRRLTAEGALEFLGNRRVVVPQLTQSQLDELAHARLSIEPKLAKIAAQYIDDDDIIILKERDLEIDQAIATGDIHRYLLNNYQFHFTLYERAGAPILLSLARMLWLRSGPSLRVVCGRFGTANLPDRHSDTLAALRARDGDQAAAAIAADIEQGIEQVRQSLVVDSI